MENNLAIFLTVLLCMQLDSACNDSSVRANQPKVAPIYDETGNKSLTINPLEL